MADEGGEMPDCASFMAFQICKPYAEQKKKSAFDE